MQVLVCWRRLHQTSRRNVLTKWLAATSEFRITCFDLALLTRLGHHAGFKTKCLLLKGNGIGHYPRTKLYSLTASFGSFRSWIDI